jgi:hypothetical protein
MHKLRHIIVAASSLVFFGLLGVGALPASAQTTQQDTTATVAVAYAPSHCSAWVCAQVVGITGGTAYIRVYAANAFYGHFELQPPNGTVHNSPDETWRANGTGYEFSVGNFAGSYVATAWQWIGPGNYQNKGQVSFTL